MSITAKCQHHECDRAAAARGLCNRHYLSARRTARMARPIPIGMKRCVVCDQPKAFSEFAAHGGCRDGFRPECKDCTSRYQKVRRRSYRGEASRRYALKKNFGITPEQYDQMLANQGGKCAICKSKNPSRSGSGFFAIDHDHKTGEVRGLLCSPCNSGIGMLRDSTSILRSAIKYLSRKEK